MNILKSSGGLCVYVLLLCLAPAVSAQMETASLSGRVTDPNGAVVPHALIEAIENNNNVKTTTETNGDGLYYLSSLRPGNYRVVVSKDGFRQVIQAEVVLHVQDVLTLNFGLRIGSVNETVTVTGGVALLNTTNGSISTVVDHKYVENIPLNGRSFQTLILLTPGVLTNSPQAAPSAVGAGGEFSVNGQRTESNYYSVDGVSANVGVQPGFVESPSASGSLPASTAIGTTQGLVSVDALEEFRVQSSSYSAEYGRNPGGQFSFITRSGTNEWHGTAFDYLRNNIFDANDWFNDFFSKQQPPLRQNDFGGTLGGPIKIPHLYNGKDRTFFFLSYEGLRLRQPQAASVSFVPDIAFRQSAPAALQPVVNAFPLQNGPDLGNGVAEFIGTWSNPSQIDSTSVRFDHEFNEKLRIFFRFSDSSSTSSTRFTVIDPASLNSNSFTARTYTLGASSLFSHRLSNELRFNFTSNDGTSSFKIDNLGGAQPVDLTQLQGINPRTNPSFGIAVRFLFGANAPFLQQNNFAASQKQWNLVDVVSFSLGRRQLKFGADYRRMSPIGQPMNPQLFYFYLSLAAAQANSVGIAEAISNAPTRPVYTNVSSFVQEEWRPTSRLSLSMGLRWDINPAPSAPEGNVPYTVRGSSLATLSLAPQGTALWNTTWFNFAPRLGAAYILRNHAGYETVVRAGGGVFFDTGQQLGSQGYFGPGFQAIKLTGASFGSPVSFPNPVSQFVPAIVNPPVAPFGTRGNLVYAFPEHLQLPYTLQWTASVEQALGQSQVLRLSYVGANGRKLLEENQVTVQPFNPNFGTVVFIRNGLTSSYNALQMQYQRKFERGLQALASYTWSHCIDYGSNNAALPFKRGDCDFDIRRNLSGALSYDLPSAFSNRFARALLHHWGVEDRLSARTAFPVNLTGRSFVDPASGQLVPSELNLVSGMPLYLFGSQYPGGREINPAAFGAPPAGQAGNAPRNFVRGFGAWQMDIAVRREFPIYERLKLQFRAEVFNVFNHPNFGLINSTFGQPTFGQATQTLANSLGVLSPIYQMGGARSMQLALKLVF